jgi:hypothetical protein
VFGDVGEGVQIILKFVLYKRFLWRGPYLFHSEFGPVVRSCTDNSETSGSISGWKNFGLFSYCQLLRNDYVP